MVDKANKPSRRGVQERMPCGAERSHSTLSERSAARATRLATHLAGGLGPAGGPPGPPPRSSVRCDETLAGDIVCCARATLLRPYDLINIVSGGAGARGLPEFPPRGEERPVSIVKAASPEAEVVRRVGGCQAGSTRGDAELVDRPVCPVMSTGEPECAR